jgi:hypothetical protein
MVVWTLVNVAPFPVGPLSYVHQTQGRRAMVLLSLGKLIDCDR